MTTSRRGSAPRIPATKSATGVDTSGFVLEDVARWFRLRRHVELTLYGAVTMLAAVFALTAEGIVSDTSGLIGVMWASAAGLMVAHWFAASVSGRVMSPDPLPLGKFLGELWESYPLLISAGFGTLGAVLGTLGPEGGIERATQGADIAIVSLCAIVAWRGAASHDLGFRRKALITFGVVLFASIVAGIKTIL